MTEIKSSELTSRARVSGVSGKILYLLKNGARSTAELVAAGGFSKASAFQSLKKLKGQGLVETERLGRTPLFWLTDAAAWVEVVDESLRGQNTVAKTKAGVFAKASGKSVRPATQDVSEIDNLTKALASVANRFTPITDLDEKLVVLDRLAALFPQEVAALLKAIRGDLTR